MGCYKKINFNSKLNEPFSRYIYLISVKQKEVALQFAKKGRKSIEQGYIYR
ncbi:hypothetical protein LGL08_07415 [Clostridium estertheticum]|uniref:hypothetical protein n=1 Tax=Clostridium estertheticum TaxID=238834 RepID=UPI001CF3CB0D|nr:hypothetical protein [Clostridium estertheticum]MCB2308384.1 hypothetical protein [Clostridium estertheticum]MCB2349389.1 hypothetical protein [Clostridium estertheticum]